MLSHKVSIIRWVTFVAWIGIAVLAAMLYGIANDQITVTISPEYFSVFKREQFAPILEQVGLLDAPTRAQALVVGVASTWWYGLFLGIVLGFSSMAGRYAPLPTRRYVSALAWVMAATLGASVLFGATAYVAEPFVRPDATHWPFLAGIRDVRRAFAVCWWHNGAYLGALVATIAAGLRVQKQRRLSNGPPGARLGAS